MALAGQGLKLLIAIKGCWRDVHNGFHQAMRDTWLKDVRDADVKFFVGSGPGQLKADEEMLSCPDDYMSLPHKTRAILTWSLAQGYDYTFLADTDTYAVPDRFEGTAFWRFDLTGLFNGAIGVPCATEGRYWAWISGGNGFWLSPRAAETIISHPVGSEWAEDRMVGQALGPHFANGTFKAQSHDGYGFHYDGDPWRTWITSHYCSHGLKRSFDAQWMHNRYAYNVLGGRGMVHV